MVKVQGEDQVEVVEKMFGVSLVVVNGGSLEVFVWVLWVEEDLVH